MDANYMREYRKKRRLEALVFLGRKCVKCETYDGLEFDHIDPRTKRFNISGSTASKKDFWEEVNKCQLLCPEHHKEKTNADRPIPDCGTYAKYRAGCNCRPCTIANSEARRRWNMKYRGRP